MGDWLDVELTKKYGDDEEEEAEADSAPKGQVVVLTDKTFKSQLAPSEQITLVKFFAPWCGHCKSMAPAWVDLAKDQEDDESIMIAEVDCTTDSATCTDNGVKGYPTIKAFKGTEEIEKYAGARNIAGFKVG